MKMAENIYATTYDIISTSKSKSIPTFLVANEMAEDRIKRELDLKSS